MTTRAREWIPVAFLGLAVAWGGCDKPSDKSPSAKSKSAGLQSIPKQPSVKLLNAGTGPKQKLRYRFRAPETHGVELTIAMSVGVSTKERSVPVQKMPDMRMDLTLQHLAVSPAGVLKYSFKLTRAGLVGESGGAMKQRFAKVLGPALTQLVGLTGNGVVTPAGESKEATIKLPDSVPGPARKALQSLQEQIQQLATRLPTQAVGVGAQWEVSMPLTRATVRLGQVTKYTLAKRQGSKVSFDLELVQVAPEQELKSSQIPRGAKAMLHSLKSSGKGRLEVDLTRPVPRGWLRYGSKLDQTISAGGKSRRMQLDLSVNAQFKPK